MVTSTPRSSLSRYRRTVVGNTGLLALAAYETAITIEGLLPGSLGALARRLFFPRLLAFCGRGVTFGRRMTLRRPGRIEVGDGAFLDDGVVLAAKGDDSRIIIGARARVGFRSVLSCRGGTLTLGPGSAVGDRCRLGSLAGLTLGDGAVVEDGCYVAGGGHAAERLDLPVILQPESSAPVSIGRGARIGRGSVVLAGVSVGERAVVAPGSLVNRDVPAGATASGVPARVA